MTGKRTQRTVKVALVLYGGVSLAVYENGVTRCFYDLVKARGIFGPLLDLLGARAEVDVISGTSAGGINGLILAAALESGQDFADSAKIWRELGDFGELLRGVYDKNAGSSLLRGETRYRDELIKGFTKFCRRVRGYSEYPGEIDVFLTGTELDGTIITITDDQGHAIADKTHRAVFHLKHRPGRRHLGIVGTNPAGDDDRLAEQAHVLAALARITSCFPAAFPPFSAKEMPEKHQKQVLAAMNATAGRRAADAPARAGRGARDEEPRSDLKPPYGLDTPFLDGGLLDNKPFGHALNAIFYRMPAGLVDRRLFFVEPDPVPADRLRDETVMDIHSAEFPAPAAVAVKSLTTVRGHESIVGDLESLSRHNAKIDFLHDAQRKLTERLRSKVREDRALEAGIERDLESTPAVDHVSYSLYRDARIESLSRLVAGASEQAASADRTPREGWRQELLEEVRGTLERFEIKSINPFDIDLARRYAFHLLYQFYEELEAAEEAEPEAWNSKLHWLLGAIGWHVSALEVVRSALALIRNGILERFPDLEGAPSRLERKLWNKVKWWSLLDGFSRFLDGEGAHWAALAGMRRELLAAADGLGDPESIPEPPDLSALSAAAHQAALAIVEALVAAAEDQAATLAAARARVDRAPLDTVPRTVLLDLVDSLRDCVEAYSPRDPRLTDFYLIDQVLFPLTFSAGVHELDRIEFVRVSPADAQRGASRLDANRKISGDELAHFAAFLRRDWRSNDVLWGRLDGTCQIIESLLDRATLRRLRQRAPKLTVAQVEQALPESLQAERDAVCAALTALAEHWPASDPDNVPAETAAAERALVDALIAAGQQLALQEDLPAVYEDRHYQDIEFGRISPTSGWARLMARLTGRRLARARPDANEQAKAVLAREMAERHAAMDGPDQSENFKRLDLGAEPVTEALPRQVIGEYVTRTFVLLWAMVQKSLGERAKYMGGPIRRYIRNPMLFANRLFLLMREETALAAVIVSVVAALLLGGFVYSVVEGIYGRAAALLVAFLAFSWLFIHIAEGRSRALLWMAVILSTLFGLIVAFVLLAAVGCFEGAAWDTSGIRPWLGSLLDALTGLPSCLAGSEPVAAPES